MRILVVSRSGLPFPSPTGGAEMLALRQAMGLADAGADVVVVGQGTLPAHNGPGSLRLVEVGVRGTTTSSRRALYYAKVLLFAVAAGVRGAQVLRRDRSIEIVHSHHSATVLVLRALAPRRPVVHTVHDNPYDPNDPVPSVFERAVRVLNNLLLERLGIRLSDHVIAVSPEIDLRLKEWGVSGAKVTEIWPTAAKRSGTANGPVEDSPGPVPGPNHPYLLSVGDLTGRKRMDLLVESLKELPAEMRLVIVGRGPDRRALDQEVRSLGLNGRVTILDYVSSAHLTALQRGAIACVLASEREGLPTSLIEAVREGTPCVYATVQSVSLPDTEPFLAHLVANSPVEVASEIRKVVSLTGTGGATREQVRRWAEARFPDPDAVAQRLLGLYAGLLGSSRAGPSAA